LTCNYPFIDTRVLVTDKHIDACACTHADIVSMHAYIHTYVHTSMHAYIHAYIFINMYICMRAYIFIYTYIDAHTYQDLFAGPAPKTAEDFKRAMLGIYKQRNKPAPDDSTMSPRHGGGALPQQTGALGSEPEEKRTRPGGTPASAERGGRERPGRTAGAAAAPGSVRKRKDVMHDFVALMEEDEGAADTDAERGVRGKSRRAPGSEGAQRRAAAAASDAQEMLGAMRLEVMDSDRRAQAAEREVAKVFHRVALFTWPHAPSQHHEPCHLHETTSCNQKSQPACVC